MPSLDPSLREHQHLLYADHHGWLYAWLCRRLRSQADAADLAHDTFLRAFASPQLGQLEEPRAFLCTLAKRILCTFWRRQELERAYLDALAALPEAWGPSEEELALLREALEAVDRLLDGLPGKVRHAFLLNRLEGLTHVEIAARLGVSVATIERWMKRALTHCFLAHLEVRA
ncbi:putative RNA polymerase sigma factor FecI [compost metagenome]